MIIRVVEQYHDYEPTSYYIDTDILDPENPVEQRIRERLQNPADEYRVYFHARTEGVEEPHVSNGARLTTRQQIFLR